MTRLDKEKIKKVNKEIKEKDKQIKKITGLTFKEICKGADYFKNNVNPKDIKIFTTPIEGKLGKINGFSKTVSNILNYLGFNSKSTKKSDVAGFTEAIKNNPNLIFMADNEYFISYNTKTRSYINNDKATARGYSILTKKTIEKNEISNVLLIGLGNVGKKIYKYITTSQTSILNLINKLYIHDKNKKKVKKTKKTNKKIKSLKKNSTPKFDLIIDVTPEKKPIKNLKNKKQLITIQPGVPPGFSKKEVKKSFYDPLALGVGSMAFMALNNPPKKDKIKN